MLSGFFILLLFLFFGEGIALLINNFVPGSVCGMLLLFIALRLKIINANQLKPVVDFILKYLALFFVPAGVGILVALDLLQQYWLDIVIICTISSLATMYVVAGVIQFLQNKKLTNDK